ncbi:hypothetical protein EAG_14461 [Camponotus floridanus]|uniref:Uncharacterized protein n=1 Tax=Camponotus floridanus TaxID=104421 RepID=E2APR7_CAMFO|nr:hypothetical protein EAG_14461 [Camponotus floridanus]
MTTSRPYQPNDDIALADAPRRSRSRHDVGAVADRSPEQAQTPPASSNGAKRPESAPPKVNFRSRFFPFSFLAGTHYPRVSSSVLSPEPVDDARLINEQGTLAPANTLSSELP